MEFTLALEFTFSSQQVNVNNTKSATYDIILIYFENEGEIDLTDIDEVNDVIQETDEETYALDFEFTEEKEYKTVQKYELVTILSYLIGVRNEILDDMCSDEYVELLNSLRESTNARILRYLCKARTSLLRNYKKTDNEIKYNLGNINRMEWFDAENINKLESWEVHIILYNSSADKYCVHINKLINEHVDACKKLFPDWVKWELSLIHI